MHVTCYVPLRYLADFKADWRFGEGQGSDRVFADHNLSQLVSIDFFTVPTIRFQVLYVFLVLAHDRRRMTSLSIAVLLASRTRAPSFGRLFVSVVTLLAS